MQRVLTISTLALAMTLPVLCADQKQPTPKSKGEVDALQAMFGTQDPDARIKAADALLSKYADTEFKGLALYLEAVSYQQKNDFEKMIVFAEQSVQADPKQYAAMLMLAKGIAQKTREFDLDREEKLTRAEKYAKDAMEIVKDAPKPNPQITDDQWTEAKKQYTAQGHEALGYAAMARKNYDKVMAMPDLHPSIRQFAQAEKVRATQLKSGGTNPGTPAAPAPPAQVEIKKQ